MRLLKSLILLPPLPVISCDHGEKGILWPSAPLSLTWRKARPEDLEDRQQE